ncbi:hypothetical protein FQN60_006128 [Etheostoma spectabile]|uniref:Uncharacterized protein n=1 Tax=Etheostoma spectabile TaxID=54343 RepID=A0A5J5CL88_9PERO|nr:hypothetical protein FQN60_006128 [Etheostoma spectabile]
MPSSPRFSLFRPTTLKPRPPDSGFCRSMVNGGLCRSSEWVSGGKDKGTRPSTVCLLDPA